MGVGIHAPLSWDFYLKGRGFYNLYQRGGLLFFSERPLEVGETFFEMRAFSPSLLRKLLPLPCDEKIQEAYEEFVQEAPHKRIRRVFLLYGEWKGTPLYSFHEIVKGVKIKKESVPL